MKLMKFALVVVAVLALFEGTEQSCSSEERGSCEQPQESIVQLTAPRGYQFVQPSFVELKRCTGLYCDHPAKKCSPKEDYIKKVRFEVNAYSVTKNGKCVVVEAEEHEKCECECARPDCPERKKLNRETCECECSHDDEKECNGRRARGIHVMWHPTDCLCPCDRPVECQTGFEMDNTTCKARGFSLNKQEFVDAIALRYGWPVEGLPSTCVCSSPNDVNHTMTCKKGGFVCIRHDEVRDLTASMLREVCHDVSTEPTLLPLDGEHLRYRTANTTNEARVDVSARGFWTRGQKAFMDIRIFDPMAACHHELSLEAAHRKNEQEKIRAYGERIQHVDQGSFTPLVFTTSGGMGSKAQCFYSRLADLMAEKKHQPRSHVVAWMRCRLSFSLLRSALLCLRGTRHSTPIPADLSGLDCEAAVVESGIRVDRVEVE